MLEQGSCISRGKQFKLTYILVHLILANMTKRKSYMYVLCSVKVWTTGNGHRLSRCYLYGHPSERGYVWHIKSRLSPLCDDFFMEASYQFSSHKFLSFPSYIFDVRRILDGFIIPLCFSQVAWSSYIHVVKSFSLS